MAAGQQKKCKRRKESYNKIAKHGHLMISRILKQEGVNWKKWQVIRHGTESNWAVEKKVNQYYEIIRLE